MYHVYILKCKSGELYIGQTQNLEKRLARHKRKPSSYMRRMLPIQLIACKEVSTRSEASQLENYLKCLKKREAILKFARNHFAPIAQVDRASHS